MRIKPVYTVTSGGSMSSMDTIVVNIAESDAAFMSIAINVTAIGKNHCSLAAWTADAELI